MGWIRAALSAEGILGIEPPAGALRENGHTSDGPTQILVLPESELQQFQLGSLEYDQPWHAAWTVRFLTGYSSCGYANNVLRLPGPQG